MKTSKEAWALREKRNAAIRAMYDEMNKEQNLVKARTAIMNGYVKTFVDLNPDKEPDEIKLTVKVIE